MEELFAQIQEYLDDSANPEMLKANPNLVKEAHQKVFDRLKADFEGKPVPELKDVIFQYFGAYLNEKGKTAFFPPDLLN